MEELMIPGMKNIDYDKTADNVARFLTDKRYYPRLYKIYQQASPEFIQNPSLSGMPGGSIGNSNEEKLVKYLYAKSIVDGVADTYDKGSVELKVVLDNTLGKISAVEAMMRLHFEKTRYYQIRKMALNEFADGLEMKINCPDLHIYV
nr:transcriptional regulator [Ligilactobacillus sp. MP3]